MTTFKEQIINLKKQNKKLIDILQSIDNILFLWHKDEIGDYNALEQIWNKSLIDERIIYSIKNINENEEINNKNIKQKNR